MAISVNMMLSVLFFLFAVLIDSKKMNEYRQPDLKKAAWFPRYLEPDTDVIAEAQAVATENATDPFSVKVKGLHKVYGNGYPAIGGVSFGMKKGEVIGLLGPNGAGKSTTFSVLTMETSKSYGEVKMNGINLEDFDCQSQGKRLGLAAQSNVIWDTLTVDEHLEFIAKVKGLSQAEMEFQMVFIKSTLDLIPYGNKMAKDLSGGNKRKLCCAVSLLANPTIDFLDEPTTGVDPIARRSLFKMLKQLKNSSILLTTHRMDEAESLCDKIAIMINGKFVCFGSPGHLKQRYG